MKRSDYESSPFLAWNGFIDLISEPCEGMTQLQREATELFLYESEVQNGGHLQSFENQGSERAQITLVSLGRLGATCQQQILSSALGQWSSAVRERIKTTEEYSSIALEGEFESFDRAYH